MCKPELVEPAVVMFYILFISFILAAAKAADKDQPCQTPDQKDGHCIPIDDCQSIINAVKSKNDTAIQFAKQSQCGFSDQRPLVCCNKEEVAILTKYKKFLPGLDVCGIYVESRLFGGTITLMGQYPWMVVLEYKRKSTGEDVGIRCAGSLINKRYVLTDVNCFSNEEFELNNVRLGEYNTTTDPDCEKFANFCADPVRVVKVNKIIKHPDGHNIGLIRMENDIDYTDSIQPICLPRPHTPTARVNASLIAAGWGNQDGKQSDILLRIRTNKLTEEDCKQVLEKRKANTNEFCWVGDKPHTSPCLANRGSPVIVEAFDVKTDIRFYQEGVLTWKEACDNSEVYTNVVNYMPWILDTISSE